MESSWSRRTFVASAMATAAAPAIRTVAAAADAPLILRCSLETAPSHTRNAIIRDYLGRIETAAGGKIKTQLFESGQLFPDLQVGKAISRYPADRACHHHLRACRHAVASKRDLRTMTFMAKHDRHKIQRGAMSRGESPSAARLMHSVMSGLRS